MKNAGIKTMFGFIIFVFSVALAYFTANYLSSNSLFDYWGTLSIFAGTYVLIGIVISSIYSISLGFLFSADILVIHLLFQYYGKWADILKVLVISVILIILYAAAGLTLGDEIQPIASSETPTNLS